MANVKKVETTTKKEVKKSNESVKPTAMVSDIKEIRATYGKSAIIIKENLIFRTSTQTLEKGPLSLMELYLPNYGKMRKFIVLEDGVYEITTKEIQSGTQFAQFEKHEKVNIDIKEIDFNIENAWNFKKVEKEATAK